MSINNSYLWLENKKQETGKQKTGKTGKEDEHTQFISLASK